MIRIQFLLLCILLSIGAKGQINPKYRNYEWDSNPKLHTLTAAEQKLDELVLKEKHAVEFLFEKKDQLVEYKLYHTIIRVNSSTAIENNNKIYIPNYLGGEFLIHQARVISPKGKVVTLSEKDIKEAEEENSKVVYRFFALEGLEPGSEIEHVYLLKRDPRYTGIRETLQGEFLKKNLEFEIISPANLKFVSKSYNGFPELEKDKTDMTKNILYIHVDSIQGMKEEKQSLYRTHLQSIIYKIGGSEIISYGKVSQNVYKSMMAPTDAAIVKKIKKIIDQIDLKSVKSEQEKVKAVEYFIKTNYTVVESSNKSLEDLSIILDKKTGNHEGIVKLFAAVFNQLKVDYQIVLTCNREQMKFDPEFESYLFLNNYLIYFPSVKQYLEPSNPFNILGFVNPQYINNWGLFIKEVDLGSMKTGVGKVQFIEAPSHETTFHNLDIVVDFKEDLSSPAISIKNVLGGYFALYFQPYYSFYTEDEKEKVNAKIMESYFPEMRIENIVVENAGREFVGKSPFNINMSVNDENMLQKAGGKYLLKLGETIGVQMEMYQNEERKTDVENDFNRSFIRKITVNIPKGYEIINPEVLDMDVYQEYNGEKVTNFTSKHNLVDGKCIIDINEYYSKITFNKNNFEDFRKVVNAAADFNKIVLVLQKL